MGNRNVLTQARKPLLYTMPLTILRDGPVLFLPLGDAATPAVDLSASRTNGVVSGDVLFHQPGLLSQDPALSMTFNGAAGNGAIAIPLLTSLAGMKKTSYEAVVVLPTALGKGALFQLGDTNSGFSPIGIGGTTQDNAGANVIGSVFGAAWVGFGAALTTGVKHHVCVTIDGSATAVWTLYVDGSTAGATVAQNPGTTPTGSMYIGNDTNLAGRHLNIKAQYAAFYGYVLTPTQVATHALAAV